MNKTYVMLGRTGDILNLLPAIEYDAKLNNYKPRLMVAKEYGKVLDGVNYVEKVIFNNDFRKIISALELARRKFPEDKIINCAVYGENYSFHKKCFSFLRESWWLAQSPIAWGSQRLNITNRSKEREEIILKHFNIKEDKRPFILTALNGTSSPLQHKDLLLKHLTAKINNDFRIIDISDYRAEYIFDLLALYEKAHCLISIDSAPLHLANAVDKLPVISLISDLKDKWHQSYWRQNHILRILYSEIPNRLDEIVKAAEQGNDYDKTMIRLITSSSTNADDNTKRRNEFALASWYKERILAGVGRWEFNNYNTVSLPKIKAMIDNIYNRSNDNDILMIVNSDINFIPGITAQILHEVERHDAVYFHRYDFQKIEKHLVSEAEITKGKWYCGSDAFAFTKKWWTLNKDKYPDMYYAREYWDMIMRNLIKRQGGVEIYNSIYHEKHISYWERNRNDRENLINRSLAKNWLETYGGDWNDWKYPVNKLKQIYKYD